MDKNTSYAYTNSWTVDIESLAKSVTPKQIRRDHAREFIPEKIIYNENVTICIWPDGTKTSVKPCHGDHYSEEMGVAMCTMKKLYGGYFRFANKVSKGKRQEQHNKK